MSGNELWKTDGTTAGTVLAKDIWLGPGSSNPDRLKAANGLLFLRASGPGIGAELWTYTPAGGGTTNTGNSNPADLTPDGSYVYFSAEDGLSGRELWVSDGAAVWQIDINFGNEGSDPDGFLAVSFPSGGAERKR